MLVELLPVWIATRRTRDPNYLDAARKTFAQMVRAQRVPFEQIFHLLLTIAQLRYAAQGDGHSGYNLRTASSHSAPITAPTNKQGLKTSNLKKV
jgi:hypothetical protein